MLGTGRASDRRVTRHTITFRVAGEQSACDRFVQAVLSLMLSTWDVSITYERRDNHVDGDIPQTGDNSV